MRRFIAPILVTLVLAAAVAAAQGPGRGPGRGSLGPPPGGGPPGPPIECLTEYLSLTDAQVEQWQQLNDELRATVEPLHNQLRELDSQLSDQLQAEAPDATAIGELTMTINDLRTQLRAAHEANETAFTALLTDEQKTKHTGLREMRQICGNRDSGDQNKRSRPQRGQGPPPQRRW